MNTVSLAREIDRQLIILAVEPITPLVDPVRKRGELGAFELSQMMRGKVFLILVSINDIRCFSRDPRRQLVERGSCTGEYDRALARLRVYELVSVILSQLSCGRLKHV